jgi:hypothetical protein
MVGITRFGATSGAHRVELEFDKRLVVMNRARLYVDGQEVDSTKVVYGDRDLRAPLADGTEAVIRLHSGMSGELTRAQIERGEGQWEDMQPVTGG